MSFLFIDFLSVMFLECQFYIFLNYGEYEPQTYKIILYNLGLKV